MASIGEKFEVEGTWEDFHIQVVNPQQDISRILNYLTENFHRDEPMGKWCPFNEEFITDVNNKMRALLESNSHLSLIATHKITGEVAGVQLQFNWKKDHALEQQKRVSSHKDQYIFFQRKVMDAIYKPMDELRYGLFDRFGVNEIVWNFVASTSKQYRGLGIASEMYRRMVILLKQQNYSVVFSIFSSEFSRKCAAKQGFIELGRSRFIDAIDTASKLPLLPDATGEEDFASLMVLEIKG